jgi:tellurite methyltransferase
MAKNALEKQFGEIDIYVFDQLLKGRIAPGMRVLDAGCGSGRNLVYLLREGYEVYAADVNAAEVDAVRAMARALGARLPEGNFRVEAVEAMSFDAGCADVVVCNTVLHFARDDAHFRAMVDGLWRVLRPGGILFCRLGSTVGMETRVERVGDAAGRRYRSPDGSVRYLVDEASAGGRDGAAGWGAGGPDQDDGGAGYEGDDDLGGEEEGWLAVDRTTT